MVVFMAEQGFLEHEYPTNHFLEQDLSLLDLD